MRISRASALPTTQAAYVMSATPVEMMPIKCPVLSSTAPPLIPPSDPQVISIAGKGTMTLSRRTG